jgi:hypothetical protein
MEYYKDRMVIPIQDDASLQGCYVFLNLGTFQGRASVYIFMYFDKTPDVLVKGLWNNKSISLKKKKKGVF